MDVCEIYWFGVLFKPCLSSIPPPVLSITESHVLKTPVHRQLSYRTVFPLKFCLILLHIFWDSVIRYLYVYNCYIFIVDWLFIIIKCLSLLLGTFLFLQWILFDSSINHSSFLMIAVRVMYLFSAFFF